MIISTEMLPLFVYGTLRPGGGFYTQLEHHVLWHEPAIAPGFDLHIGNYPVLAQADDYTHLVHGDLLWFHNQGRALRAADKIESYHPPKHTMYLRSAIIVYASDILQPAWAYLRGPGTRLGHRVESGDYREARPDQFAEAVT